MLELGERPVDQQAQADPEEGYEDTDRHPFLTTVLGDGLLQRDGDDLVGAQRCHAAEFLAMNHVNGA